VDPVINIKSSLNYTINKVMKVLDKAIVSIPDDKLDFKPQAEGKLLSLKHIAYHIYHLSFIYTKATINGSFDADTDFKDFEFDMESIKSSQEIVEYGGRVKKYINNHLDSISNKMLEKKIKYKMHAIGWGEFEMTGFSSMITILEEAIHHRGQICIYLRILGIDPPFIYDYS
jgi:uncharacterized damage-inducible protein DinB